MCKSLSQHIDHTFDIAARAKALLPLFLFAACHGVRPPCASTADCEAGETCVLQICQVVSKGAVDESPPPSTGDIDPLPAATGDPRLGFDPVEAQSLPPCTADAECAPPQSVCDQGSCIPGCGVGGGLVCAGRDVCDTNTGHCVALVGPCTDDAACGAPNAVCELGQCVPGCMIRGGVQCTGAASCNAATGRCDGGTPATNPGACTDDPGEDDDDPASARALARGATNGVRLCPGDDDHFAIMLSLGETIEVTLGADPAEGDVDVLILDPQGRVAAQSSGAQATQIVRATAAAPGRYVVRATLAADAGPTEGADYTLGVRIIAAAGCGHDAYEDNDSDATAYALGAGTYTSLSVCTGAPADTDDDFFAVQLRRGQTLAVRLDFANREGNIELTLRNPSGTTLMGSWNTTDWEQLSYTASRDETVHVLVYLGGDRGTTPGNEYQMQIELR